MDTNCLQHSLTESERAEFEEKGYLIIEDVLPQAMIEKLSKAVDRTCDDEHATAGLADTMMQQKELINIADKERAFIELMDWPKTFPKVWGVLGPAIHLYLSQIIVTPPASEESEFSVDQLNWHQDGGQINIDLKDLPGARLSLKVGYFLTDTSKAGRANLYVVPRSQGVTGDEFWSDKSLLEGAMPICVKPGSAVMFDRRLWHASSPNLSSMARKVVYFAYSYRWQQPVDVRKGAEHYTDLTPIQRQLLGVNQTKGSSSYFFPEDADLPLRTWLSEQGIKEFDPSYDVSGSRSAWPST